MPSQIIQNYLNDTSIDVNLRRNAMNDISSGVDQTQIESALTTKYGNKYSGTQTSVSQPDMITSLRSQGKSEQDINQIMSNVGGAPKGEETPRTGVQKFADQYRKGLGTEEGAQGGLVSPIIGGAKGVASTANQLAKAEQILTGQPIHDTLPKSMTEPTNPGESAGKFVEQAGEFLIPGAAGLKAAKGAGLAEKVGIGALESGLVTAAQTGGDIKATVENAAIGGAFPLAGAVIKKILPKKPEIEAIVGKIIQGDKADIEPAKLALQSLDTTGVKTYEDLANLAEDHIGVLASVQDDILGSIKKAVSSPKFDTVVKQGATTLKQNFVWKALDHLEELYTKTDAMEDLAKIKELKSKFTAKGLTIQEANNIAREYGSNFGKKAFSVKTGDPLTSVNAVQFENVRSGIKDVVRANIKDEAPKMLDEQMSKLYTVKRLAVQMAEKVNNLENKIIKRGLIEKIGRKIGRSIDIMTGGSLRGFLTSFLPSNIGNKVLNSVDLEKLLSKNLKLFEKLSNASDDSLVNSISSFIKKAGKSAVLETGKELEENKN